MHQSGLPFFPAGSGATTKTSPTGVASTHTLPQVVSAAYPHVLFVNIGTDTIFLRFDSTTPTVSNALPLPPNSAQVFEVPLGTSQVGTIASGAASALYAVNGIGG